MQKDWEALFREEMRGRCGKDPAHDLAHFERVAAAAKALAKEEGAKLEVVIPAAWLHDYVDVPKNSPLRSKASQIARDAAIEYLKSQKYPAEFLIEIAHAIEAHSFSAGIPARTLEAKVVQDADRLDAIGATGIARCFAVAAQFGSSFYDPQDFFAENRELDDKRFAIDHFEVKLFRIAETLHTRAAQEEAQRRVAYMRNFLNELRRELQLKLSYEMKNKQFGELR